MKFITALFLVALACTPLVAQESKFENHLFSIQIPEGMTLKKEESSLTYQNPKMYIKISEDFETMSPATFLKQKNEQLLKYLDQGSYQIDSLEVNGYMLKRSIMKMTHQGNNTVAMSVALNNRLENEVLKRKTYEIVFVYGADDPMLALIATQFIKTISFKGRVEFFTDVETNEYFAANKAWVRKGGGDVGGFNIFQEFPKGDFEGLELKDKTGDGYIIINSKSKKLSVAPAWPGFPRAEYNRSKLYPEDFNITMDFRLDTLNKEEFGFGFIFNFYGGSSYASKATYSSFLLTNTKKIYTYTGEKPTDYMDCFTCWPAFRKLAPKPLFDIEAYSQKPIKYKNGWNKLQLLTINGDYFIFLNNELIHKQPTGEKAISFDLPAIPVFLGKGDILVDNQSEEYID